MKRTTERNPSFFSGEKKEAKKSHFGEVIYMKPDKIKR